MSAAQEGERRHLHTCVLPMRWGDMDAYGHLNNVAYFRFMEEARVQLLKVMQISDIEIGREAPVVINAGCTFLSQLTYPDDLRVVCLVGEPGRSSFMIWYEIYSSAQPDKPAAEGYSKVVWIDRETNRSVPLPEPLRQQLG
ncbi:MAG TPA: thioesterase family protein [Thiolinea sp.]|nr:thioesterase family protein [Thiolinea sp.]